MRRIEINIHGTVAHRILVLLRYLTQDVKSVKRSEFCGYKRKINTRFLSRVKFLIMESNFEHNILDLIALQ